ncbi:hypothetical protein COS81_00330 [candidate division WWE3 bacterium CG06_land_8_20_14_3_00_42_16]|uniref:Uncharacterized protein n=1 Tax=candidate division WWE3 bacterium CG06_land_8_20_14_3_00_42_16 TaxID=1975083 RepID=A0A2M7APN7_UNCKA|nr:MAG: hypothetical protein COS81_00330 [candidate division WWE3 bacterium CG06_land_8_20_14_3_00_42_16]
MFLINSRLECFPAAPAKRGHGFSRSYAINLPSSLARVLSFTFVFSTHPPVSVLGTDKKGSR